MQLRRIWGCFLATFSKEHFNKLKKCKIQGQVTTALITFPDKKYIIYKACPDYYMVCPHCLVHESFTKSFMYTFAYGCDYNYSESHICSFDLNVLFITKAEIADFENFIEET